MKQQQQWCEYLDVSITKAAAGKNSTLKMMKLKLELISFKCYLKMTWQNLDSNKLTHSLYKGQSLKPILDGARSFQLSRGHYPLKTFFILPARREKLSNYSMVLSKKAHA